MKKRLLVFLFACPQILVATAYTFTGLPGGNVNVSTNWTPSGVPGIGDTVDIPAGKSAVVPAGYTWHAGTCPTSFGAGSPDFSIDATSSLSGTLEVVSTAIFEPCGFIRLNNAANSIGGSGWATLQIDTGGKLAWDENNGTLSYHAYNTNYYEQNRILVGTSGDACGLTAASCPTQITCINCGSVNPSMSGTSSDTFPDAMFFTIYGASLQNCGSASQACLYSGTENQLNPQLTVDKSIFNSTGGIWTDYAAAGSTYFLTNSRFTNTLSASLWNGSGASLATACNISGNYFDVVFGNAGVALGCNYTNNVFGGGMTSAGTQAVGSYTSWNNNWVRRVGVCVDTNIFSFAALDNENTYVTCDIGGGGGSSAHIASLNTANVVGGGAVSPLVNNFICDVLDGTLLNEGHCLLMLATGVTNVVRVAKFISHLASTSSYTAGQIWTPDPGSAGKTMNPVSMRHSTVAGDGVYGWAVTIGHSGFFTTNQIVTELLYNIGSGVNGNTSNFLLSEPQAYLGTATAPNNMVNSASVDYNVTYLGQVGSLFAPGYNSNCSPSKTQSTNYSYCEATTTPGTHDLSGVNPNYVDATRNVKSWAVRHGQASSVSGALAVFQNAPTTQFGALLSELMQYVRGGYMPLNTALWNRNPDGSTPGAVEPVNFPMGGMSRAAVN